MYRKFKSLPIFLYEIKNNFKNIELGEFIIMPNHVHGIIIIHKPECTNALTNGSNCSDGSDVETLHVTSLHLIINNFSHFFQHSPQKPYEFTKILFSFAL